MLDDKKEKIILTLLVLSAGLAGAVVISFVVLLDIILTEQSDDGKYAVYTECVEVNDACIESTYNPRTGESAACCEEYSVIKKTLGKRLTERIGLFAVVGGILGLMVGGGLAERRKIKQRKLKERVEYEKYIKELGIEKDKITLNTKSSVYDQDEYYGSEDEK